MTDFPEDCGSSLRVRGTDQPHARNPTIAGAIPACAGNSEPNALTTIVVSGHPCVCGEQTL